MLIMGGNPAENHPCGFKWPVEAKRHRNAKMIVVDPRFTRTASNADLFLQIRAGADIAFLGGLINYALEKGRINKGYLVNYSNAAFLVRKGFKLPEDGLFSGYDAANQTYDKSTWNYEEGGDVTGTAATALAAGDGPVPGDAHTPGSAPADNAAEGPGKTQNPLAGGQGTKSRTGAEGHGYQAQGPVGAMAISSTHPAAAAAASLPPKVAYDLSLEHPRCVFLLLKKQYSRYRLLDCLRDHVQHTGRQVRFYQAGSSEMTPDMVERITGIPKADFLKAAELFTSVRKDGNIKQAATIIYAVGWTQHTFGTQIIRTAAMLQLLLGNVGRAAESTRSAVIPISRAQPTWRVFSISSPAI
jgi:formate dehydrogenase major subunit